MSEPGLDNPSALTSLPIFPLANCVLLPGGLLPLHVFEPRYRAMVKDCLATHKAMAIALISETGGRDANRHPAIEGVCGLGVIIDHVELPDGPVLEDLAVADGDDFALDRLLLRGVRDDDPALGLLFFFDALDEDAVLQRTNVGHGDSLRFGGLGPRGGAPRALGRRLLALALGEC